MAAAKASENPEAAGATPIQADVLVAERAAEKAGGRARVLAESKLLLLLPRETSTPSATALDAHPAPPAGSP
jgi:hypothetical protein